ncbi:unnamed protein product [Nesidiocoris tenuis]|uniref:Dynein heavy chain coiled coil stalk domain-containing protein n=1 Tax=Nesidiocoris tenuis TaxID=355587 RepID=A0A6H5GU51_9HEMI|nr:unnamed protein product [Nesidiocoris tenuis]
MMASTTFLLQLQNYPKDCITNEMIDLLQPYFNMEDYNMETAKRVCGDVAGLLSWTKAMAFFHSVNKEVLPLKSNLALQEARLKLAMDDLAAAENELAAREQALEDVKAQYDGAVREKQRLTDAANNCLRKMTAATALINGLGGEKIRWTQQSKEFKEQLGRYVASCRAIASSSSDISPFSFFSRLVGDVLLATAFLSYCGPYNQQFRGSLLSSWIEILEGHKIPVTQHLNIINMLVESATVSEWTLQGLPNDELSVQNALIVTKSSSYPLLIDPQNQAKMWIKNKESTNELQFFYCIRRWRFIGSERCDTEAFQMDPGHNVVEFGGNHPQVRIYGAGAGSHCEEPDERRYEQRRMGVAPKCPPFAAILLRSDGLYGRCGHHRSDVSIVVNHRSSQSVSDRFTPGIHQIHQYFTDIWL